ncbi:MAG: crossover junction endodeoxyribonuclease RuvC [Oscillospiraceae bacterium]|nr:crossover junction endodeoxyribonuclease RuvC [Oscillospiraceae bacterium]
MKVLTFDQSTKRSGWAFFIDGQYIESGVVDMSKSKLDTDERSFEMAKALWKIIKKYKPNELVLEQVQNQSNTKTVITLARLAGMLIGYAEAHGVKTHTVEPARWRSSLSYKQGPKVKRAELKQQSIDYIKENFGLELSEDECESICIGVAAHKIYNFINDDIWGCD